MLAQLKHLEDTNAATAVNDSSARLGLFRDAVLLRDRIALCNPLLAFDKLLFVKRHYGKYAHMCDQYFGYHARRGGSIFILDRPFSSTPVLRDILENAVVASGRLQGTKLTGSFLSPELSYDGRTLYFAHTEAAGPRTEQDRRAFARVHIPLEDLDTYTEEECQPKWSPDNTFHIFKINVDGSGLTQLTDGPWNEFDPFELPNGRIIFTSERRGGYGRCHPRRCPSYTLHTMNNDGSDLTCISYHENPWHWYSSYMNLKSYAFFYGDPPSYENLPSDQYNEWTAPRTIAHHFGALESRLYRQLKQGHHDLKLSKADMHRITLWLDCNSDFFGAYEKTLEQSHGELVRASLE